MRVKEQHITSSAVVRGDDFVSETIYTPKEIQAILNPVFSSYNVRRAVLFGSYAKGMARSNSDIDIMVDSGLKGLRFFGLLEEVVTKLGKDVDLLDASQITPNSEVQQEIEKTGMVIYE